MVAWQIFPLKALRYKHKLLSNFGDQLQNMPCLYLQSQAKTAVPMSWNDFIKNSSDNLICFLVKKVLEVVSIKVR